MIAGRGDVLAITRVGVAALFVLAVANGVFLYLLPARAATDYAWAIRPPINGALLAPGTFADAWPWSLTPLMARAAAGWCLLAASALLIAAGSLRRRHEAIVAYATLLMWAVLLLALPVLHGDDLLAGRAAGLAAFVAV